jgi:hypothetical protein
MRYNDVRNGTNIVEGVLEKYTATWKSKEGFLQDDGLFVQFYTVKRDQRIPECGIGLTAWQVASLVGINTDLFVNRACTFMNSWNSEEVHTLYPRAISWLPQQR